MFKKTATFYDFNGNEVTEEHYFNLNKAEIFELEILAGDDDQGFTEFIKKVSEGGKPREIIELFKLILEKSYGRKSEDGTRFEKSPKIWEEFTQTEAYSEIYFSLVTNAGEAAAFVRGIMPQEIRDNADFLKAQRDLEKMSPRERSEAQMQGYRKPVSQREEATPEEQRQQDRSQFETNPKVDAEPLPSAPVQNQSAEEATTINGLNIGTELTPEEIQQILAQRNTK